MNRSEVFFNKNLRVLNVIDLASLIQTDAFEGRSIPDCLEDFEYSDQSHSSVKKIKDVISNHEGDPSIVGEILFIKGMTGLMIQVATPVRNFYGDGDGCSYSWGHYYTGFIYADSYEKAIELGCEWVDSRIAIDKSKGNAK